MPHKVNIPETMKHRNVFKQKLRDKIDLVKKNIPAEGSPRANAQALLKDLERQLKYMETFEEKGFKAIDYNTLEFMEKEDKQ